MPDGLVVVDKPPAWTSHDVVGRLRRLAGTRKVGHAGTLDPMATGLLIIGVDRATRLLGHLSLADKTYLATIRLGESTTTDDAEGESLGSSDASGVGHERIRSVAATFVGDIEQVPSSVSAIKVDGQRAYARVRAGEQVHLDPRAVHVSAFDVTDIRNAGTYLDVDVQVSCSSGTYVRAFARDLGWTLAVGGHLTMLRRTRVGPYTLDDASTLEQLETHVGLLRMRDVARRSFPSFDLDDHQASYVRSGRLLASIQLPAPGPVAVFDPTGEFLALYEQRGGDAKAVAVFVG